MNQVLCGACEALARRVEQLEAAVAQLLDAAARPRTPEDDHRAFRARLAADRALRREHA